MQSQGEKLYIAIDAQLETIGSTEWHAACHRTYHNHDPDSKPHMYVEPADNLTSFPPSPELN